MKLEPLLVSVALALVSMVLSGCGAVTKAKDSAIEKYVSPAAIEGMLKIDDKNDKWMDQFCEDGLTMNNITGNIWWPGCGDMHALADFDKCDENGCITKKMALDMDAFNNKYGGKLVNYMSRAGKDDNGKDIEVVPLTGWWLPAPHADANTPRIVVQHGFTSNSNKFRQQYVAYQLRKLGFSVLVNNLRDHCYSGDSKKGIVSWGHSYPLDELGAWDYAKDHAAAPIDASKVGMLGFSMGGFTTVNAFGVEGNVPAAWIDGAPFTPKAGFEVAFKASLPHESLGKLLTDSVWEDVEKEAEKQGVDINGHLPEKELPNGPNTRRSIFVTANKNDAKVPFSSSESLVALLKKYPEKYDLKEFWQHDDKCLDVAHCVDHLIKPSEYAAKLCTFWSGVFKTDPTCGQGDDAKDEKDETDIKKLYEVHGAMIPSSPRSRSMFSAASLLALAAVLVTFARRIFATRMSRQPSQESDTELVNTADIE